MDSTSDVRSPPAKILAIDDNESNRVLVKETLEDEGHVVVLAASGQEGIAAFERDVPDCVLLDVRMPELDGFAVCERLRALPQGAEVPIVFLTALRDVDTFDHALKAGADDYLTKPIRPAELVVRVKAALKLREMRSAVRTVYDVFKEQRDGLVRLQLDRERVIAFLVHDLKTPLNAVDLNAQLLLTETSLSESGREAAHEIRSATRQLNRMIMNLLDLAKAEQGQLAPTRRPVEIAMTVQKVLDELRLAATNRGVVFRRQLETPTVYAEEDLLRRVLANLIENAIRYSPPNGEITISSRTVPGGVELRVSDAGAGVPPSLRERIFESFSKDDTQSRDNRGLGLTFCKQAIEAHGGRVSIEDGNPGAIFCAFFPDAAA